MRPLNHLVVHRYEREAVPTSTSTFRDVIIRGIRGRKSIVFLKWFFQKLVEPFVYFVEVSVVTLRDLSGSPPHVAKTHPMIRPFRPSSKSNDKVLSHLTELLLSHAKSVLSET